MPIYLVESYAAHRPSAIDTACQRATHVGELEPGVRYLRTTFIPTDETLLQLFEASSAGALRQALRLACVEHERIVEAIEGFAPPVSAGGSPRVAGSTRSGCTSDNSQEA